MKLKSLAAAAALTVGMIAGAAQAATLSGTFTIDIYNYGAMGSGSNAAATHANTTRYAKDATVTYTGALDFGIGSGNSNGTSIADFFASGSGDVSGLSNAVGDLILSNGRFNRTTLFDFTASITDGFIGDIAHDDGISFFDNGVLEVDKPNPTVEVSHAFDFAGGDFRLIYAAANGNPSVLNVTGDVVPAPTPVPLPASALLLIGAMGGLGALRRTARKT